MTTTAGRTSFTTLTRQQCEDLLAQHTVGRVAVAAADGPLVLPVNYRVRLGDVVFRTSAYGPLAELAARTRVAFEVDEVDEAEAVGWSVLVRGFASGVVDDHDLARLWASGPQPWASGSRTLMIRIEPTSVTGRSVRG